MTPPPSGPGSPPREHDRVFTGRPPDLGQLYRARRPRQIGSGSLGANRDGERHHPDIIVGYSLLPSRWRLNVAICTNAYPQSAQMGNRDSLLRAVREDNARGPRQLERTCVTRSPLGHHENRGEGQTAWSFKSAVHAH
jgi:hypothetical protein